MPGGMPRRDQHVLLGLAVAMVAFAVLQPLIGVNPDLLLAAPVVMLLLPLLTGRYLGEDGLVRLAARSRPPRARTAANSPAPPRAPRIVARGGRLIASALAERGPPALSLLAR
jgi:hypothetical protein